MFNVEESRREARTAVLFTIAMLVRIGNDRDAAALASELPMLDQRALVVAQLCRAEAALARHYATADASRLTEAWATPDMRMRQLTIASVHAHAARCLVRLERALRAGTVVERKAAA